MVIFMVVSSWCEAGLKERHGRRHGFDLGAIIGIRQQRRLDAACARVFEGEDFMAGAGDEATLLAGVDVDDAIEQAALGVEKVGQGDALGPGPPDRRPPALAERGDLYTCGEAEGGKLGLPDEKLDDTTRFQLVKGNSLFKKK